MEKRVLSGNSVYNSQRTAPLLPERTAVWNRKRSYFALKRVADIVLSSLALVLLMPVFIIVALLIRLDSKGGVIYSQQRIGKNGKPFRMYKFRSMYRDAEQRQAELSSLNERDGPVFKIRNDPRVTRVGRFIRKTCVDELPQLLNIIKGDMSIVGPRPPLPCEVEKYTPYHRQRLDVQPGLTCYWQVRKGEATTFDEWVDMDLRYIYDQSAWVDLKIILLTFKVVFRGRGSF